MSGKRISTEFNFRALSFLTMREHFSPSSLHRQCCIVALKRLLTPWPSNGNVQDVKILWRCNLQRDLATSTWTLPTCQKTQMGGVAEVGMCFKKMMRSILRFLFLGCLKMQKILNLVFNVLCMPEIVQGLICLRLKTPGRLLWIWCWEEKIETRPLFLVGWEYEIENGK